MDEAVVRELKIKTGVVKRLTKEKACYAKEAEVERERIVKMKEMGKEAYDVKRQEEVVQECLSMILHVHKKLLIAYNDLKEAVGNSQDLSESKEYLSAKEALDQAQLALASP